MLRLLLRLMLGLIRRKRRGIERLIVPLLMAILLAGTLPLPALAATSKVLPAPAPKFRGKIGVTYADSQPDFPKPVTAPANAPQRPADFARRHGIWPDQHLWRRN